MRERGWYVFVGILTVIAGVVTLVWPISSIVVLAITAGVWLASSGSHKLCGPSAQVGQSGKWNASGESLAPSAAG